MAEFYMLDMDGKSVKVATTAPDDTYEARWTVVGNNYYRPKNAKPKKQKTPPAEPTFNEWGEVGL